ncbi:DUF4271 domain-containing protein [Salegentibacter mishustinae]|uniref:DUF4271 domain-containing protein n=1 Tax=Salegentibacter mishustinae TaxID=270918 RepID=UPI0029371877|nr:DUF4271 domain-containing protein [Salegentibacter mishustinae]
MCIKNLILEAVERHINSLDWITLTLMGAFLLLAIVKTAYPQRFEDFLSLLTSNKFMMFRGKKNKAFHPFNILLFFVHLISFSLLFYLFFNYFWEESSLEPVFLFIRIATAYASFVLLKFGLEKIVGNVFDLDAQIDSYLYQKISYRNFIGLILLIPSLIFIYTFTPTAFTLYSLLGILVLTNIFSLLLIYRKNQSLITGNWFYFILYLCALEIAPYIILYKLITI